jgi:predicted O-linked N-acetylglucosamine transferase (SPINDLY family)
MTGSKYFEQYNQIDVALDPFPYAGGTTTCDALWMGVPVVSLTGKTAVSRGGLSILSNLGKPEWATGDPDRYMQIAVEVASDLPRLAELRASLRQRMLNSPLMDAPQFARDIEAAYHLMWQNWCERK